jgi:hypothetical protein
MSKCRALADENEEMGRELAEGKVHQLEAQLAIAKDFAAEMRTSCLELEDHCCMLDEEAEELQREVFALRREAAELKGEPPSRMDFMGRKEGGGMPIGGFRGGRGGRGGPFKRPFLGPPSGQGGRFMDPPPGPGRR